MELPHYTKLIAYLLLSLAYLFTVSLHASYRCTEVILVDKVALCNGPALMPGGRSISDLSSSIDMSNCQIIHVANELNPSIYQGRNYASNGYSQSSFTNLVVQYMRNLESLNAKIQNYKDEIADRNGRDINSSNFQNKIIARIEGFMENLNILYLKVKNNCQATSEGNFGEKSIALDFDSQLQEMMGANAKNVYEKLIKDLKSIENGTQLISGINEMVLSLHNFIHFCIGPYRQADESLTISIFNFYMFEPEKAEFNRTMAEGEVANDQGPAKPVGRRKRASSRTPIPNNGRGFDRPLKADDQMDLNARKFSERHTEDETGGIKSTTDVDDNGIANEQQQTLGKN